MNTFKPKVKKCRNAECRAPFTQQRPMQIVCGPRCARALAITKRKSDEDKKRRAERAKIRAAKERLKTRSDHTREAQAAFNSYIRERDRAAGYRCISSGRVLDWSGNAVDAGHYRSIGSAPHLRFDERNCHAQSKLDNRYLSGNAVDYRIGLIARIGLEAVEALEADQEPRRYTIEELQEIKRKYRGLTRELIKRREAQP